MRYRTLAFFFVLACLGAALAAAWIAWPGEPASTHLAAPLTPEPRLTEAAPALSSVSQDSSPVAPTAQASAPAAAEGPENERAAVEGLSLLALFQTHDSQVASAVVLAEGYGAYRYGVGEWVAGRYLIHDIQPDHLVMEGDGKEFRLFLTPLAGGEPSQTEAVVPAGANGATLLEQTRAERERMRLLSAYDLYPVVEGAAAGYVIGERFPRDARERMGVEPGDIVLSVNGFAVGEPVGDEQAMRSAQTAMEASVVFQRQDGSIVNYHYPEDDPDA